MCSGSQTPEADHVRLHVLQGVRDDRHPDRPGTNRPRARSLYVPLEFGACDLVLSANATMPTITNDLTSPPKCRCRAAVHAPGIGRARAPRCLQRAVGWSVRGGILRRPSSLATKWYARSLPAPERATPSTWGSAPEVPREERGMNSVEGVRVSASTRRGLWSAASHMRKAGVDDLVDVLLESSLAPRRPYDATYFSASFMLMPAPPAVLRHVTLCLSRAGCPSPAVQAGSRSDGAGEAVLARSPRSI